MQGTRQRQRAEPEACRLDLAERQQKALEVGRANRGAAVIRWLDAGGLERAGIAPEPPRSALFLQQGVTRWQDASGAFRNDLRYCLAWRFRAGPTTGWA